LSLAYLAQYDDLHFHPFSHNPHDFMWLNTTPLSI
jgi:hypothetical protein